MSQGGQRAGAGRKPGIANAKTREIADRAIAEGKSPLEIMLSIMREQWEQYEADRSNTAAAKVAAEAAKDAAPYIHPRLTPTDATVDIGPLTGDLAGQSRTIMEAVSNGDLTPSQAHTLMQAVSAQARIIEVAELERRISELEKGKA